MQAQSATEKCYGVAKAGKNAIQFLVYPANWPKHLMWGSILAYVLTRGPGALSLDRIVAFNLFGRAQAVVEVPRCPARTSSSSARGSGD